MAIVKTMAELKKQDKTLWQKICRWFRNLAEDLKAVVEAYKGHKPDSNEGRMVAGMRDVIGKLESLYADALMDAGENFQTRESPVKEPGAVETYKMFARGKGTAGDLSIYDDPLYPDTERERGAFNRQYINKTSDLKTGKIRDIIITTSDYCYFVRAYGTQRRNPYKGEILRKELIADKGSFFSDMREEIAYGTYDPSEANDLLYEDAQRNRRRNTGHRPSLRERLDAEGYGYLLDEES